MRVDLVFLGILALAAAQAEKKDNRIMGGTETTINQYPFSVAVLYSRTQSNFQQLYGGTILNQRSVLTIGRIFNESLGDDHVGRWRNRVGSTYANSGGTVHEIAQIFIHEDLHVSSIADSDIAIMRHASLIVYIPDVVAPVGIAGENYVVPDGTPVWAIGWGRTEMPGSNVEQLRHVQVLTVSEEVCRERFAAIGWTLTDNILCTGWIDVGGRDQCGGDNGSPLLHNNVVIGVYSFGNGCGLPFFPSANVRVTRFIDWIRANA